MNQSIISFIIVLLCSVGLLGQTTVAIEGGLNRYTGFAAVAHSVPNMQIDPFPSDDSGNFLRLTIQQALNSKFRVGLLYSTHGRYYYAYNFTNLDPLLNYPSPPRKSVTLGGNLSEASVGVFYNDNLIFNNFFYELSLSSGVLLYNRSDQGKAYSLGNDGVRIEDIATELSAVPDNNIVIFRPGASIGYKFVYLHVGYIFGLGKSITNDVVYNDREIQTTYRRNALQISFGVRHTFWKK